MLRELAHHLNAWLHRVRDTRAARKQLYNEERWIAVHHGELLCAEDLHCVGAHAYPVDMMFDVFPWVIPWERRHRCVHQTRVWALINALRQMQDEGTRGQYAYDSDAVACYHLDQQFKVEQYLTAAAVAKWGTVATARGVLEAAEARSMGAADLAQEPAAGLYSHD